MTGLTTSRVAPFGHLGITACVPLPRASRSLPRPSSPPCAQASPTCLPSLDHNRCCQAELRALFLTSDLFLRKVISIGFINPTIYHASVVKQRRPSFLRGGRGRQSRVGGQNVSKRSDYVMLSELGGARAPSTPYSRSVKEVIQPQVPLRLPCYDFTPVTSHSLRAYLPCGLARPFLEQLTPMV